MIRFKLIGWGLISALVLASTVAIDQVALFSLGRSQNHFLFCRFWASSRICLRSAFRPHPSHLFLLDPNRSKFLSKLARSPEVPVHDDYQLNENGFRTANPPPAAGKKIKVNIFGDSFAFGLFLKESEHVGSILNAMPSKCEFRNYGVPAFDLRQMLGLSRDASLVSDSDVDLFLFISDDIFERITRPFEVHRFGRTFDTYDLSRALGMKPALPFKIPPFLFNNSFLFQSLELIIDREFWQTLDREDFVGRIIPPPTPRSKPVVYLHIPIPEDYEKNRDGILSLSQPKRLVDLSIGERVLEDEQAFAALFFRGDGHPNPEGARWIAGKVMERLKKICQPL